MSKVIFEKVYSSEELNDLDRDLWERFDPKFNPVMETIEQDEYGFHKGSFTVKVVWEPE